MFGWLSRRVISASSRNILTKLRSLASSGRIRLTATNSAVVMAPGGLPRNTSAIPPLAIRR